MVAFLFAGLASCSSDDDDNNSGGGSQSSGQWFTVSQTVPWNVLVVMWKKEDIEGAGGTMTMDDLRNYSGSEELIHIINSNTLEYVTRGKCYEEGAAPSDGQLLYRLDTESPAGIVSFYSTSSTPYTYEKIDNKLYVVMWGKVFTVTNDGLWEDGGQLWRSYNPNTKIYHFSDAD